MYANILVEYGAKALDQTFTYIIPDALKDNLKVGMKVKVPFRNTLINGFVLEITNDCNNNNLKEIASLYHTTFIDITDITTNKDYFFDNDNYELNYKGHKYISEKIINYL